MKRLVMAFLPLVPISALAQEGEWTFELRFQPDDTGARSTNAEVTLEDGELDIEENGETDSRSETRSATPAEADALRSLVDGRIADWEFAATERVPRPHLEVTFEWDGEGRQIEVTEVYPAGQVPREIVDLQELFFETVYD